MNDMMTSSPANDIALLEQLRKLRHQSETAWDMAVDDTGVGGSRANWPARG